MSLDTHRLGNKQEKQGLVAQNVELLHYSFAKQMG